MVNTVKGILGIKTSAQKRAEALQQQAVDAQTRSANAAMEDGAVQRSDVNAAGRRLRGLGRRSLAFMGSEMGVSDSLSGSGPGAA